MRTAITLLFMFALSATAFAQGNSRVWGSIADAEGKPVSAATVSLLKSKDSSLVKLALSDKAGVYEFLDIHEGKYLLSFSSVGFGKKFSSGFEVKGSDLELPLTSLQQVEKSLNNVTVTATRPFVETHLDKTIVNVEASPSSAGATALEVLEKSPGIMVNSDGIISLRGKQGVIVMLDGKPTYLSAGDLANLLKNMPASALDQIEIMTNPSAKYDASGNAGVINIKTKKGRAAGFNGSVMAGITSSIFKPRGALYLMPKSQNSFNFNYRKNKVNFFGNYNPNFSRGKGSLIIERRFFDANNNIAGYSDVDTRFKFGNNNHTLKLGVDFFADKKNTYGIV